MCILSLNVLLEPCSDDESYACIIIYVKCRFVMCEWLVGVTLIAGEHVERVMGQDDEGTTEQCR